MKHRNIVKIAIFMLVVYGLTVLLYPTLFNPDDKTNTPIAVPPLPPKAIPQR